MKKIKRYTFKEFKEFMAEKCWDLKLYKHGKYDRKIWNWFDVGKSKRIEFYGMKNGKRVLVEFKRKK